MKIIFLIILSFSSTIYSSNLRKTKEEGKYIFGVDVGGTETKLGFFEKSGKLIEKWSIKTDHSNGSINVLPNLCKEILNYINKNNINKKDIIGVGIDTPGIYDSNGINTEGGSLHWGKVNVAKNMSKYLKEIKEDIKIKANNDAKVAALGEQWKGKGKNYKNVVLITLGTGTGGGIILDGKILSGTDGIAGEFSYMHVNLGDFDEKLTYESGWKYLLGWLASGAGIVNLTNIYVKETDIPSPIRDIKYTAKDIVDYAKKGDKLSCIIFDKFCQYLGKTMSNIAYVVNPEIFILGGGVSKAGEFLIKNVEKYFNKYFIAEVRHPKIELADLGNDAGIYGSAKLVLDE